MWRKNDYYQFSNIFISSVIGTFTCCRFTLAELFCAHPHMSLALMEPWYYRHKWTLNPFCFPMLSSSSCSGTELLQDRSPTHKNRKRIWGWEQPFFGDPRYPVLLQGDLLTGAWVQYNVQSKHGEKDEGEHPCQHCWKAEMQGTWHVLDRTGSQTSMWLNWEGRRYVIH